MMTFENKRAAERAYVRAQIEKPRLREISFGKYQVTSQAGDRTYALEYKKVNGKLVADCSCPAGRKNSCCKHALAGYSHFKMRVNERAAAAALAPAAMDFQLEDDTAAGATLCSECAIDEVSEESEDLAMCQYCFNSYLDELQYAS